MTSAVHSAHPPVQEAGLADGCPACAEIAADPTAHLDDETLGQLATLATATDRLSRGRSENELVASANVLSTLERVGRLAEAAPSVVAYYLREKWRLDVQIDNPFQRQAREQVEAILAPPEEPTPEEPSAEPQEVPDPACECGHRLSEHEEEDGPGHAGCRAQVVVEGADASKGDAVYRECDCAGFVSRDLALEQEEPSGA